MRKGTKFDCAKSWTGNYGQNVRLRKSLRVYALPSERSAGYCKLLSLTTLDEFEGLREKGIKGGGGTDFRPVFDYITEHDLKPETMVYLTDLYGDFPHEAPAYPVVWAATTNENVPWGDVVRIKN